MNEGVVGRFAPSPTGPLHAGSLVAALGSRLDARARGGEWRLRIEDLDTARNVAGAAEAIAGQLGRLGLLADGEVRVQSRELDRYRAALDRLLDSGAAFPCACSRSDLAETAGVYPGTCRTGLRGKPARSIRLSTEGAGTIAWHDRRLGAQAQELEREVGDFVLERADGVFAYQLAVVVDDAADGITDVVRGEDLADNTARQIWLQRRLGLPTPRYLHLPLVRAVGGEKLSKQTGAAPLAVDTPAAALAALREAGRVLGVAAGGATAAEWLDSATRRWRELQPL